MANQVKLKKIKEIEKHLRNYRTYKIGIKTLTKQLEYIMPACTVNYELKEGSAGTFSIASQTERFAIDRIESKKALVLHEDIARYSVIVDCIEEALAELSEQQNKFLELRYMERYSIGDTALEMGYSEKQIYNLRNDTFDVLLISLSGLVHM